MRGEDDHDGPLTTWRWHEDRRPEMLKFAVSADEKRLVRYHARLEGVTVSEFIRRRVLMEEER